MRGQLTEEKWMEEFVATANDKSVQSMWGSFESKMISLRNTFV